MKISVLFRKVTVLILGLACIAIGVAFAVNAQLGISPISCVPYVYSLRFSPTIGELTMLINLVFLIIQIAIEHRNYNPFQLIQLPILFIFGYFVDAALYLIHDLPIHNYFLQFMWCIIGCIVLAIGIVLEIKSNLTTLPSESVLKTVSSVTQTNFGKLKIFLDTFLVTSACISSFLFFDSIEGVREGTLITAVLVGYLIKKLDPYSQGIELWIQGGSFKGTSQTKQIIPLRIFSKRIRK